MEDSNKTRKLLVILVLTMGLFCLMLCFGIMTRPKMQNNSDSSAEVTELDPAARYNLTAEINQLTDAIDKFSFELKKLETEKEQAEVQEVKVEEPTPQELYWQYAHEITAQHYPDVSPEYVYAIIYHESRYQPDAINKKTGVVGLMQINPKWHTKRAESLGVTDLKDPYGNILVGCDILHELTQKEDFNYALNFFAGGYPYANKYRNEVSPYVKELREIMQTENAKIISGMRGD